MIERFSQSFSAQQLVDYYQIENPTAYHPNYNAAPSQLIPVLTHDSPQGISFFYWGMAPRWVKNKSFAEKTINIRAEQITEKPVIQKNLMRSRCIIPADGFYCWKKVGKKTLIPWRVTTETKSLLSFAGIWEEFEDDGETYHTFLMITQQAPSTIVDVCERTPLTLSREDEKKWLSKNSTLETLLTIVNNRYMPLWTGYSVSPQLNDVKFNQPSLLIPVPPADQFGNLTLFN